MGSMHKLIPPSEIQAARDAQKAKEEADLVSGALQAFHNAVLSTDQNSVFFDRVREHFPGFYRKPEIWRPVESKVADALTEAGYQVERTADGGIRKVSW